MALWSYNLIYFTEILISYCIKACISKVCSLAVAGELD